MTHSLSLKEKLRRDRDLISNTKSITWDTADWRAYTDERAAIYEFEAGWPPQRARVQALKDALAMMDHDLALMERKYPELRKGRFEH